MLCFADVQCMLDKVLVPGHGLMLHARSDGSRCKNCVHGVRPAYPQPRMGMLPSGAKCEPAVLDASFRLMNGPSRVDEPDMAEGLGEIAELFAAF